MNNEDFSYFVTVKDPEGRCNILTLCECWKLTDDTDYCTQVFDTKEEAYLYLYEALRRNYEHGCFEYEICRFSGLDDVEICEADTIKF